MSRGRILIVDDDIVVLRTLRDGLLAHGNIDVITATSANDALELLTLTQVDVVLTAADLGEADGADLIAEARRRQPSARGVVMLAAEHEEGRRRSVAAGASAFLGRINAALVVLSLREADVVSAKFTLPREAWTLQVPVMELLMQAAQREDEAALERARLVVERSQAVLLERVPAAISAVLIDLVEDATLASAGPPTVAPRAAIDALRSLPTDGAVVPESVRIGYADGTSEFVFRLPNRRTVQWVRARSLRGVDTELQLAVSTSAAELEAALDLVHPVRTGNSTVARIVTGA
jgi:DNA-binding NarL/FixJ family response regulator